MRRRRRKRKRRKSRRKRSSRISSKESRLSPMVKCDQESEEGDDDIEVIGRNSHESPILLNAGEINIAKGTTDPRVEFILPK